MKKFNYINLVNYIYISVLIIIWVCVFIIKGLAGAIAWTTAILFIPIVSIGLLLISLVFFVINIIKKKKIMSIVISMLLLSALTFPVLITAGVLHIAYPANIEKVTPSVTVKWPFKEETVIGSGGNSIEDNKLHGIFPSERWAYDLVMEPYETNSNELSDYGIYNKEVLSPVNGTVVAAYDKEYDIAPNTEENLTKEGNYVYLKIEETGTFLLLNHLKKDSVTVRVGDHVKVGQTIGRVGNSGSTSEPHLHIQHQRQDPTKTLYPLFAEGLPLYFENIVGDSMPVKGSVINILK